LIRWVEEPVMVAPGVVVVMSMSARGAQCRWRPTPPASVSALWRADGQGNDEEDDE
jgi:hypothetical protein